jgi:cephalosporin-C deacetylase-like acetyl esterase
MEPEYQLAYLNLVLAGFVVLAYDPIGQGERRQYWNPHTGRTEVAASSTYEHSMPGQLLILMGEDLTHYRIWDAVRAIDYLESRPEVDSRRIGCAGHSGGGTLTLFTTVVEERIRCAVVNQGGTGHRWPLVIQPGSRVGPSDVEQNLFPAAVHGIDQCDLHVAIAPRPLLAMIENYSPRFDLAAAHIRRRYEQLGAPERFATEESTDPHSWTVKLRLATTDWFSRWFYQRRGPGVEPDIEPEPAANLYCTPNGSLRYPQRGDSIFSLIHRKQEQLPPPRRAPASAAELESYRRSMREEITRLIRYQPGGGPLGVRHLVTTPRKGYRVEKLEFLSEPGVYIPAWVFLPDDYRGASRATLYVNEAGKQADGLEFGIYERLARQGKFLVAVDVRGIGETRPPHDPPGSPGTEFGHLFDVDTAMAYMAWYMDVSLLGMRVQDVVRGVDYVLSRRQADPSGVRLVGKGAGALWALFAAALDERVSEAVLERGLVSYRSLTAVDRYLHGAGIFIRDVLLHFDLPQVAAAMAGRRLTLAAPVDAMKRPVEAAEARRAYAFTEEVYRNAGAAAEFRIADRMEA